MIRHIVLCRFSPATQPGTIADIFAQLRALKDVLPGLEHFAAGPNASPEGLARGFTHGFTVDFASAADRDAYLAHPAHQAAGEQLVDALDAGLDGLMVVDIPLR
jgi:hypothetical protein